MLEKYLQSYEYQYNAARDFRLAFILRSEDVADLETDSGEYKCGRADETDGGDDVDVGQERECDTDGESVNACRHGEDDHRLE